MLPNDPGYVAHTKRQPVRGMPTRAYGGDVMNQPQYQVPPSAYYGGPQRQQPQKQMPPVPSIAATVGGMAGAGYVSPAARERQEYERALKAGTGRTAFPDPGTPEYDPALAVAQEQAKRAVQQQANAYGTQRINQLQGVVGQLPPELQQAVQQVSMVDPAAAWRALSGAFTSAATQAGYNDPRMWLKQLQMQGQPQYQIRPGTAGYHAAIG